jgi:hypothetical protein
VILTRNAWESRRPTEYRRRKALVFNTPAYGTHHAFVLQQQKVNRVHSAVLILATVLVQIARSETNTLAEAIARFPELLAYRPDEAVRSANRLIAAGETAACQALRDAAEKDLIPSYYGKNHKILLLCRLLFEPRDPAHPIRPPADNLFLPVQGQSEYERECYFPFVITNDVPLLLPRHLPFSFLCNSSSPEFVGDYLAACRQGGVFRTKPFPTPTLTAVSNAVSEILGSAKWKRQSWTVRRNFLTPGQRSEVSALDWAGNHFWQQVENMKMPIGKPQRVNRIEIP